MEYLVSSIAPKQFFENLLSLKSRVNFQLPSEEIVYECSQCEITFPITDHGFIISLQSPLKNMMNDELMKFLKEKIGKLKPGTSCVHESYQLREQPKNILLMFEESDSSWINNCVIGACEYQPTLCVSKKLQHKAVFFVLLQNLRSPDWLYHNFIKCNFDNYLNVYKSSHMKPEESMVFDDETLSIHRENIPRLSGGGRKLHAGFNYECCWCPTEDVKSGKKGRFKEYRAYLSHFKSYHNGENGEGVPMEEFYAKVVRNDPKWFCTNCKNYYSMGHRNTHRSICSISNLDQTTPSRDDIGKSQDITVSHKRKNSQSPSYGSYLSKTEKRILLNEKSCQTERNTGVSRSCQTENNVISDCCQTDIEIRNEDVGRDGKDGKDLPEVDDESWMVRIQPDILDEFCVGMESLMNDHIKIKLMKVKDTENESVKITENESVKITENESVKHTENEYVKHTENESVKPNENIANFDNSSGPKNTKRKLNKWWMNLPKNLYGDRGHNGPKIFLENDSEEFVQKCLQRHLKHEENKKELDLLMLEAESDYAKERIFSLERDQPFLDRYEEHVRNSSKKDALNLFAEEYELLQIHSGQKANTGKNYRNRIVEFFTFMAKRFDNFHLDWMVDCKGKIEKIGREGQKTYEIFLPIKEELKDFIKQYKYGGEHISFCFLKKNNSFL